MQLFSFRIILGPPRQVTAICGATTLVKIFFRKFIIKSWSLEVIWAVYKSWMGTRGRGHWDACVGTLDLGTRDEGLGDIKYGMRGRVGQGSGTLNRRVPGRQIQGRRGCE